MGWKNDIYPSVRRWKINTESLWNEELASISNGRSRDGCPKILFTWPSLSRCLSDRWAVLHHYSGTLQNRHRFPTLSTGRFQLVRLQGLGNQDLDTTTPRRSSIHWLPDFDPSETGQPVWLGRESENGSRWHSDLGSSSIYHPGNSKNTLYNFRPLRGIRSGQQCTRWELE